MSDSFRMSTDREDDEGMQANANEAIAKYSHLVERRMKVMLCSAVERRDKAFEQITEVEQTEISLKALQFAVEENAHSAVRTDPGGRPVLLETRVNVGEQFYVHAHVYDADPLIVDVGFGIMVEMSLSEATTFFHARKFFLNGIADKESKQISELESQLDDIVTKLTQLKMEVDYQGMSNNS